ncbi:hypothetical protein JCM33374_g6155 [Metschnikowia sp. JCM 33374]|nr:hypothetical protein JCM33374_g6155 [Metschnikowia sp. JCM 33374]
MPFVAAINNSRNIATWTRACVSLAGVSDQISFTVSETALTMLAVSSSRTTHGEIVFERDFFKEIAFTDDGSFPEGSDETSNGPNFSFVVASRHLVMLLKNSDAHSINYVCLRVENSASTPESRKYKLNVEILTKKLVLKKYQISFSPADIERTDIPHRYDALLHEHGIYTFTIDVTTIKSFLDTAHASTEDFGIEVKAPKIIFKAYTKQVVKDKDYLKQPMQVSISMAIDDLDESNLNDVNVAFNFRLRDFRIFLGLVASLRPETARSDSFAADRPTLTFQALFGSAGDPILFQHTGPDLAVKFIQMTSDENGLVSRHDHAKSYILHVPVVVKKRPTKDPEPISKRATQVTKKRKVLAEPEPEPEPEPDNFDAFDAFDAFDGLEPTIPTVTYGGPTLGPRPHLNSAPDEGHSGEHQDDDTDYDTSENESETEFGPTQIRDKPTSLFR